MSQAKQDQEQQKYFDTHSAGTEWGTPVEIWRPLAEPLDGFDIDLAAGAERYPVADRRITKEDNIFATEIDAGDAWCNPEYGPEPINPNWAGRLVGLYLSGAVDTLTVLLPNSSGSQWYGRYIQYCDYKTEIRGRQTFYADEHPDHDGDYNASFWSVVFSFGDFSEEYVESLHGLGRVLKTA